MSNIPLLALGIEVSSVHPVFAYAALDADLKLSAVGQGPIEDLLAYTAGVPGVLAAVSAPAGLNRGCMAKPETRALLNPVPASGDYLYLRQCEYELAVRGVSAPHTPGTVEKCPAWVRRGFNLYERLINSGFQTYPLDAPRRLLETHSAAVFQCFNGRPPLESTSLEGRLQRQLILYEAGLPVCDPMDFFEELTRRKLILGLLPLNDILSTSELDALAAAYVAWLAIYKPFELTALGNPEEGLIYLPPWKSTLPDSHRPAWAG